MTAAVLDLSSRKYQCPGCGRRYAGPYENGFPPCRCRNGKTGELLRVIRDEDAPARFVAPKVATILDCPRCGGVHELLSFQRIPNAADRWKYEGACPATGKRLLLSVEPSKEMAVE